MGIYWVKFRLKPGADAEEVRRLAAFVSGSLGHRVQRLRSDWEPGLEAVASRRTAAHDRLLSLIEFPGGSLCSGEGTALSGDGAWDERTKLIRTSALARNSVIPIEWRDDAWRTIVPDELPALAGRWRKYVGELRAGQWRAYLRRLRLYDLLDAAILSEAAELSVGNPRDTLTLSNAWCRKEGVGPARDGLLEFDAPTRLRRIRERVPLPWFRDVRPDETVTPGPPEGEALYDDFRRTYAGLAREWNRVARGKWKVGYPPPPEPELPPGYDGGEWLAGFLGWCEHLTAGGYGLYLW